MTEVYSVYLDLERGIPTSMKNVLLAALPEDKQQRIRRYVRMEDALRSLVADILIRLLLCQRLHVPNHQLEISQNAFGKPQLAEESGIYFNCSHSGAWVVCAISSNSVGIDVEKINEVDLNIADRFFSRIECEMLYTKQESEQLDYFYNLWTLKESYIKAVGMGLSLPLDSFSILINEESIQLKTQNEFNHYFFKMYPIDPQYKLALCSAESTLPDTIACLSLEEVYEQFSAFL